MRDSEGRRDLPVGHERPRDSMPEVPTLLRWVYFGRLSVSTAVVVAAALYFSEISNAVRLVVATTVVLTWAVTAVSAAHTHVRRRPPSARFLCSQILFDLALVTTVVYLTGGVSSDFASLYILVIGVSAVTVPFRWTLATTTLAASLYFANGLWARQLEFPLAAWLQIGVFVAVALATGWLASRVRVVREERHALEREVKRLRLEASDILREISGGIVTVRADGSLVFANASAERLLGFSADGHLGVPFLEFLRGRSQELWNAIFATQRHHRRQVRAEGTITLHGRSFPIGVTTTPHHGKDGEVHSVTAIFTDISDQQRINELNLRTERLEAIAALSASLAHEIKNPLASIRSSVEQLGRSARADDDDRFLAELIVRESDRLSRLLTDFLDFSRVRMTDAQTIEVQAIAQAAIDLVREHPDCPSDSRITLVGSETRMRGDEDLIHRIVVNLVLNALQASGGRAEVTVSVGRVATHDLPSNVSSDLSVLLRVSDDGPGIPDHLRKRLFEPFVTGRVGGTGLGLAVVQRAVEAHRGMVFVDSSPESGTTFSIYLPSKGATEAAA